MTTETQNSFTHIAYRIKGTGEDANWIKIGNVFKHSDGKGFDLVHNGLTEDIRIVIRERKPQ